MPERAQVERPRANPGATLTPSPGDGEPIGNGRPRLALVDDLEPRLGISVDLRTAGDGVVDDRGSR